MPVGTCQFCGAETESHVNTCDECAEYIEHEKWVERAEEQRQIEEREMEEREMEDHFRRHPHG